MNTATNIQITEARADSLHSVVGASGPTPCKHCGKMPGVIPISSFYRYMVRCGNHACPVMPRTRHLGTAEIAIGCWNILNAPCPENREPLTDRKKSVELSTSAARCSNDKLSDRRENNP